MKTIFVTVAEFLENNGYLKEGREVFRLDRSYNYSHYGEVQSFTESIVVVDHFEFDEFKYEDTTDIYVRIECIPVYK